MREGKAHILVVEDEEEMQRYIQMVLEQEYSTVSANNGLEALAHLQHEEPDLIILDLMMPHLDGLSTCRQIRRISQCPIIVLSALQDEEQKVQALEEGADDYLTKPFGPAELMARVKARLRRTQHVGAPADDGILHIQDLEIDLTGRTVRRDGQIISLTRTEFKVLKELILQAGRVVSHRALLQAVWGPEYGDESEYLYIYIGRLRRKLEPDPDTPQYLLTEPGLGYRLALSQPT